ncbi:HlyD family efflux transporter periplasmic adaptor subunit [Patescibacteria group bacterium]|nr:HlyD family efflux transporter periplasmic adaptor subunit [Patescibacteria group bacterium]
MKKIINWFRDHKILAAVIVVIVVATGLFVRQKLSAKPQTTTLQTATVERGTLVVSVAESGNMASANRLPVTTQASGQIKQVFVKNGQQVSAGQNILELALDQTGQQRNASAWASYLSAQNNLTTAQNNLYSLQSTMYTDWQKYMDIAQNSTYQNSDGTPNDANRVLTPFTIAQDNWLSAEATYKNQQNVITQNQAALSSAWLNYQGTSAMVTAPTSGIVSDLVLTPGMAITSTTNSSNVPSATTVGSIVTNNAPTATFSLSEIDATKVKEGQKATLTLDALPGTTFTGTVVGINRSGVVSSNVTTYPMVIQFDTSPEAVLPNMSVTANIITQTKDNALLIPTAAVTTQNGQSTVRVKDGNNIQTVPVTLGVSSDTQTEITSGLTEGQTVIVGGGLTTPGNQTSSPFGGGFRIGGGGAFRRGG